MQKTSLITNRKSQTAADHAYWLTKTPQERLAAIEFLRQQYIKFKFRDVYPRFCRVFTIVNRKVSKK
jgi:very-short-patch-repair endonuclease